jgi:hypothetical protein
MKSIDIGILGYINKNIHNYNKLIKEINYTCDYRIELNNQYDNSFFEIIQNDIKILVLFNNTNNIDFEKYDWIILCTTKPIIAYKWKELNDMIINPIIPHNKLITLNASLRNYQHIIINNMHNFIVGNNDKSADDILPIYINKPIQKNNLTITMKDTKIGSGYLHLRIFKDFIIYNFIQQNIII